MSKHAICQSIDSIGEMAAESYQSANAIDSVKALFDAVWTLMTLSQKLALLESAAFNKTLQDVDPEGIEAFRRAFRAHVAALEADLVLHGFRISEREGLYHPTEFYWETEEEVGPSFTDRLDAVEAAEIHYMKFR